MQGWALFLCAAGLGAAVCLLLADERRRQHDLLLMERMRGSMLYYHLYALVVFARKHALDRVLIERDRVVFYALCPPGRLCEFILPQRGYRPLTPKRVWALVQVLAEDIPALQNGAQYKLRRYTVVRANGQKDDGYTYFIRPAYKTTLMYERKRVRL